MLAAAIQVSSNIRLRLCGIYFRFNLGLSEEMYEDGYQHLTNIDISFTVVKQMQEMYKEKIPNLPFK